MKCKTTEDFIIDAKKIHGDKYDYSLVDYKNCKERIKIICSIHGDFEQTPDGHLTGRGCFKCSGTIKRTKNEFIEKDRMIYGDKYDYSLVEYINNFKKVKIICKKHGVFEQQPNKHLLNQNCILCSGLKRKTTEEFILQTINIHGDKYDYSLVEYKNTDTKIKIICPIHGLFYQKPSSHLNGHNCSFCKKRYFKNDQHLYIFKDIKYNIYKIDPTKIVNKKSDGRTEWFNFDVEDCVNYINNLNKNLL